MVSAMNGFIAGTVFIWPAGGNGGIQPPAVCVGRLGAGGLRLIPMWVCAPYPGKPYFTVEGRKLFAGERRRRLWGFAPHTRESLILPLRGANFLPGKAPAAEGVCAPHPGKPYSSVEGRKPVSREPAQSWCTEPRKSLIFRFRCTKL